MGLYFSLHTLLPRQSTILDPEGLLPPKKVVYWEAHSLMADRVSWPATGELPNYGAESLANLCLYSWLYGKIAEIESRKSRHCLAPLIAVGEDFPMRENGVFFDTYGHRGWVTKHVQHASMKDGVEVIIPFWDNYREAGSVDSSQARHHNAFLALPKKEAQRKLRDIHRYADTPFIWVRASEVAIWIGELLSGRKHRAQLEFKKHKEARAIVKARQKYLEALAGARARVLFDIGSSNCKVPEFF